PQSEKQRVRAPPMPKLRNAKEENDYPCKNRESKLNAWSNPTGAKTLAHHNVIVAQADPASREHKRTNRAYTQGNNQFFPSHKKRRKKQRRQGASANEAGSNERVHSNRRFAVNRLFDVGEVKSIGKHRVTIEYRRQALVCSKDNDGYQKIQAPPSEPAPTRN